MTEEEFLALVDLVEFESESLDNFELNDKEKDKSIRENLIKLKEFIKRQGQYYTWALLLSTVMKIIKFKLKR